MYKNYGDVNFFECGRLVDTEHSDTKFGVLFCQPLDDVNEDGEEIYLFASCTVDIEEDWINKNDVMQYIGMNDDTYDGKFDAVQFALGCVEYYGVEQFGVDYYMELMTKAEVLEELKKYLIAYDNLNLAVDVNW